MSSPSQRLQKGSEVLTIHATSDFAGLLVAPADGSEVGLVIQEARVEEWLDVRVGRLDVDLQRRQINALHYAVGILTLPRLAGYSRYWNMVIYLPGGRSVWSA